MTSFAPPQSEMDRELLRIITEAVEHLPPDAATLTQVWSEPAGMWFVEVHPALPKAAPLSLAFDGDDLVTITAGNTWFELFPIKTPSDLEEIGAIAHAVFRGQIEESGLPRGRYARIRLKERTLAVGEIHLPWPWPLRPFKRRYVPYTPST